MLDRCFAGCDFRELHFWNCFKNPTSGAENAAEPVLGQQPYRTISYGESADQHEREADQAPATMFARPKLAQAQVYRPEPDRHRRHPQRTEEQPQEQTPDEQEHRRPQKHLRTRHSFRRYHLLTSFDDFGF
jgi:hypothetical protein